MHLSLQAPHLDLSSALSRLGGDDELLREIALLFLDEYPKLLCEIQAAGTSRNAEALLRAAHSLKGSVTNFGADAAYRAALALETAGRTKDLLQVDEQIHELVQAMSDIHPELVELTSSR